MTTVGRSPAEKTGGPTLPRQEPPHDLQRLGAPFELGDVAAVGEDFDPAAGDARAEPGGVSAN